MSNTGTYKMVNGELTKISDRAHCSPDVFFKGPSFEEHLADAKHPDGQMVYSKQHKAAIMREQGVHEAGDKRHGAR